MAEPETTPLAEKDALAEVERRLLSIESPLREPVNRVAWEQGMKAALRVVRQVRAELTIPPGESREGDT